MKPATLTSQDWYRVRRGEDEIAWGLGADVPSAPGAHLSRRAGQELAYLDAAQADAVVEQLRHVAAEPYGERSAFVLHGAGRWMLRVGDMRVVFQVDADDGRVLVSTIRGGAVLDPEAQGPPPT